MRSWFRATLKFVTTLLIYWRNAGNYTFNPVRNNLDARNLSGRSVHEGEIITGYGHLSISCFATYDQGYAQSSPPEDTTHYFTMLFLNSKTNLILGCIGLWIKWKWTEICTAHDWKPFQCCNGTLPDGRPVWYTDLVIGNLMWRRRFASSHVPVVFNTIPCNFATSKLP